LFTVRKILHIAGITQSSAQWQEERLEEEKWAAMFGKQTKEP
jgi:hypothetical protein